MKNPRVIFLYFIFVILIFIEIVKLFEVNKIEENTIVYEKIPSLRGKIYGCNNQLLATSLPFYVAYFDVDFFKRLYNPSYDLDIKLLESRFNVKIDFNKRFVKLGESFDINVLKQKIPVELRKFVNISINEKRLRLENFGLEQIIGIVRDGNGVNGVEKSFNEKLSKKQDGEINLKVSGGVTKEASIIQYIPPINGESIVLSIDTNIQKILYELAFDSKINYHAENVGIILMETKTGKIRALVTTNNWPDYFMGYIEPGSAMKPMFYSAALDLGVITEDSTFVCKGYIYPDSELDIKINDIHPHGLIDLKEAISESCNVAAVSTSKKIIEEYNYETLYNIFKTFGFGEQTGIELPNEIEGVLNSPDKWSKIEWAYLPIGYSIGVTPLQLITAFNSIFNDGILIKPTLIENGIPKKYRVMSTNTANKMKNFLKEVVENGTGIFAKIPGMDIYGKTGTSEIPGKEGSYIMTFEGNFSLNNIDYTALVWVTNPEGYSLSSYVAAPIFKQVVLKLKKYYSKDNRMIYVTPGLVPNIVGWNIRQVFALEKYFKIKFVGKGLYVKKQFPEPGSFNEEIVVYLGEWIFKECNIR